MEMKLSLVPMSPNLKIHRKWQGLEDSPRSGQPSTARHPEAFVKVCIMVARDQWISLKFMEDQAAH